MRPAATEARLGPCRALGHAFTVDSGDPDVLQALRELVSPLLGPTEPLVTTRYAIATVDDADYPYRLIRDGDQLVGKARSFARVVAGLFWCVDQDVAATPPGGHLLLHAAAVANGRGAGLLPGPSGSGKSTLAARLTADGMGYLTDEVAAVSTATGDVVPYPKPISLKPGAWALFPELEPPAVPGEEDTESPWHVAATRLGRGGIAAPTPLAAVIFTEYRPGADGRCEQLRPVDGLVALAQCSFTAGRPTGRDLAALADVARRVPCYRLRFSRLDDGADRVRDVLNGRP